MKKIYPSIILINNKKKTASFVHDLLSYDCNFRNDDIEVKSSSIIKEDNFFIKYKTIDNITLSLCSRIGSSGTIGYTMTPSLKYHIDFIINTKDYSSYIFEIEPTTKSTDIIKYIKKLNINLIDEFNIQSLLSNYDTVTFDKYMAEHFDNIAKIYNLDNPRKKY
ncbi:hypothetical protein B5F09_12560 [Erysipelatoclostridium sp. An173]|uniref:hypothetical protein n=1 Tax=Erysipelatoclostridium sp. An173 TaxID=1965571 RepID=UPI000B36FACE|nr:hypothetical protein [Erysipelatoclostridium sp. An173]OUP72578.1 hypothetical protein B5F09_12560 [Erysipelatoclostridium sp. An173]